VIFFKVEQFPLFFGSIYMLLPSDAFPVRNIEDGSRGPIWDALVLIPQAWVLLLRFRALFRTPVSRLTLRRRGIFCHGRDGPFPKSLVSPSALFPLSFGFDTSSNTCLPAFEPNLRPIPGLSFSFISDFLREEICLSSDSPFDRKDGRKMLCVDFSKVLSLVESRLPGAAPLRCFLFLSPHLLFPPPL